jgi:hypothetical protein
VDREEYLNAEHVKGFSEYLENLINGVSPLKHSYTIKHPAWIRYLGEKLNDDHKFVIENFKQALDNYFWVVTEDEEADSNREESEEVTHSCVETIITIESNNDYGANARVIEVITKSLQNALDSESEDQVFVAAARVLEWGQVYRGSLKWLLKKRDENSLVSAIKDAVEILESDNDSGVKARFDHSDLRMDSGTTKIFSFASKRNKSIIYDDRVGAALGLLVVKYLEAQADNSRPETVPKELMFMRSGKRERNPSKSKYRFPVRGKNPSRTHAQSNLYANWLIDSLVPRLTKGGWSSRKLEAALFMIGYRVNNP